MKKAQLYMKKHNGRIKTLVAEFMRTVNYGKNGNRGAQVRRSI